LLLLAERPDAEFAATVEAELEYVERDGLPELYIVCPLAHAIVNMERADLAARLTSWATRYREEHQGSLNVYLSFVAMVPSTLRRSV
jgi:hypothetical protein